MGFNEAYATATMREQEKKANRNAKKAYIADLVAQGIDKEMAKIMANAFFEAGLVKAM